MCHVPSWIKDGKKVLFVTDKDARKHELDWDDATGHSAINSIFNCKITSSGEGLNSKTPPAVREAVESGKMNMIMRHGNVVVDGGGEWNIPGAEIGGDLFISGKAIVNAPKLRKIGAGIIIGKRAVLNAPFLKLVEGAEDIKGKLVAPKFKREDGK